tara:strand:- start:2415 stop:3158 length:744 start_codon:yes stop_codon:yes gene_type:complete
MDYKQLYIQELKENEKLIEELDELKGRIEDAEHEASEWEDSYNELKGEKESMDEDYGEYEEKIEDLKEENKILKDKSKGFKTLFREVKKLRSSDKKMYKLFREEADSHGKTLNNMFEAFNLSEQNRKQAQLQAESLTNAESLEGHYRTLIGEWYIMCFKAQNKKLTKYETMIHCVWSDLYWADKGGCEVSFKDVANSSHYYENEDFIKKEVVDDPEEEESSEEEEDHNDFDPPPCRLIKNTKGSNLD